MLLHNLVPLITFHLDKFSVLAWDLKPYIPYIPTYTSMKIYNYTK